MGSAMPIKFKKKNLMNSKREEEIWRTKRQKGKSGFCDVRDACVDLDVDVVCLRRAQFPA